MRLLLCLLVLAIWSAVQAEEWQAGRLPWGDPDLQGIWTNATVTTLERPERFEELVLSEREALAVEEFSAQRIESIDDLPEGDIQAARDPGGYNSFWMDPGTRVLRVRGEPRSSIIVEPVDGQVPYRFFSRMKLYWGLYSIFSAMDNPEERPLGERCTVGFGSTGGPPMLPVLYNNHYQIVQSPGYVMIMVEMNHNVRTIRLDGERLPEAITPWMGDSVGRFEGNTLVVTTTRFHPQQDIRAAIRHQIMMEQDSIVEERFTRIGEGEILYEFSVTDDDIYTEPWRGEITLRTMNDQIYEYACHEGNYGLPNILAGARQEEQK